MTLRELLLDTWADVAAFFPKYIYTLVTPHRWLDTDIGLVFCALFTYFVIFKLIFEWANQQYQDGTWWQKRYGSSWPFWYLLFTSDSLAPIYLLGSAVLAAIGGSLPLSLLTEIGVFKTDPFESSWGWVLLYLGLVWAVLCYLGLSLKTRIDNKVQSILYEIDPTIKLNRFTREIEDED